MKLTRAQRHKYYKLCLSDCLSAQRNGRDYFICWTLLGLTGRLENMGLDAIRISELPELKNRRPHHRLSEWWNYDDYGSRIKVLRACIRETSPKKRK